MKTEQINQQAQLLREIQLHGFDVVSCGHCGGVFITRNEEFVEYITCPHCEEKQERCDAPDLFYEVKQ